MRLGNKQAGKQIGLFNVIFKIMTPDKVVTVVALSRKEDLLYSSTTLPNGVRLHEENKL